MVAQFILPVLLCTFSISAWTAGSPIADLNQALASRSQTLNYSASPEDVASLSLVNSADPKRLYTAVRVDAIGNLGSMACKDSSLVSLLKKFVWSENRVAVLRVALTVNNQTLPPLPLALISDVDGDCQVQLLMGRNLTPYIRIESDYHIVVQYEVDYVDTKQSNLLKTIGPLADSALNAFGMQSKFLSKITTGVAQAKLSSLETYVTNRLTTKATDKITTDFDFRKHKGILVSLNDGGTKLGFALSVVPRLSVYVDNPIAKDTKSNRFIPSYGDNVTTILKQQIHPTGVIDVYQTIDEHRVKDDLASQRFKALADPSPEKFSQACADMVTELYTRIGQDEYDTAASLYAILQYTPHHGGGVLLDKGCPDDGWSRIMGLLGFTFTDKLMREETAKRVALIDSGNQILSQISTAVQSKSQAISKAKASAVLDGTFVYDSSISVISATSDTDRFVGDLWSLSPGYLSCFVAKDSDKSAAVRGAILVTNIGAPEGHRRFGMEVKFKNLDSTGGKISRIALFELDPFNDLSAALVDAIRKNAPSSSCQKLLTNYLSDF